MSSVRPRLSPSAIAVITGWDTLSGRVVYRTARHGWSGALGDAAMYAGQDHRLAALTEACADTLVNTPYAMEVDADRAMAGREALRETLRATGPGAAVRTEVIRGSWRKEGAHVSL